MEVELTIDFLRSKFGDAFASRFADVKLIGPRSFGVAAILTPHNGETVDCKLISVPPHLRCEPTCTESSLLRECGDSVLFVKVLESHLSMDKTLSVMLLESCVRSLAQHQRFYRQLRKRIDEQSLQLLVVQLILAVNHMHSRGILHSNIKPANVLLGHDGLWKLDDFGIAHRIDGVCIDSEVSSVEAGTSPYMAPEVIEGTRHGSRADVWSLAVVLYQLVAGNLPFDNDEEACELPLTFPPEGFPDDLRRLLCRMLCKDPAQRMPIEEVIASEYFAKALDSLKKVASVRASPILECAWSKVLSEIDAVSSTLRTCSGRILHKGWVCKPNGDRRYMVLTERFLGTSPEKFDSARGDRLGYSNAQPIGAMWYSTADKDSLTVVLNVGNGKSVEKQFTCARAADWAAAINLAITKQMMKTDKSMEK